MTTDVAVRNVELSNEQLQFIAHTEFVPPGLRGNVPAILACVATGRALGLADMTALRSIHVIDGKATFSAELMVMLVRRAGHSITGAVGDGVATVVGTRADNGDTMTVTWTMKMAEQAGLLGKGNWKKYPDSMLWARGASQLCRQLFPDCFAGATYTPEELEGSAGEPSAVIPGVEAHGASAPAAQDSGESPASPADEIRAAAEATGLTVDMADPDIPFGDAPPIRYITERQRTRLFTIASKAGVEEQLVRALVQEFTGQESTKLIPAGQVYDGIISAIQARAAA